MPSNIFNNNIFILFSGVYESSRGLLAKLLDCDLEVTIFELNFLSYVRFRTKILGESINPLILPDILKEYYCFSSTRMALA